MAKRIVLSIIIVLLIVAVSIISIAGAADVDAFERDYDFRFSVAGTSVFGLPVALIFTEDSGMTLDKKGNAVIDIKVNSGVTSLLGDIDLSSLSEMDLSDPANKYAVPIIPWFDMTDIKMSLQKLKETLGIELVLDYEEEATKKLVESIETTGRVNADFTIPQTVGIRYEGKYELKTLTTADGEEITAIYLDRYTEGGEPFVLMTVTDTDEGLKKAVLHIEFLGLDFTFIERNGK